MIRFYLRARQSESKKIQKEKRMLKDLCVEYDAANSKVDECKAALVQAEKDRSEIVKRIASEIAPKKKFIRAGKEITIVVRGSTYFFRGSKGESGLVEVE